jgi:putative SOS response-associated peptidase YedK
MRACFRLYIDTGRELAMMRWGMPPPLSKPGSPVTKIRNTTSPHRRFMKSLTPQREEWTVTADGPIESNSLCFRLRRSGPDR